MLLSAAERADQNAHLFFVDTLIASANLICVWFHLISSKGYRMLYIGQCSPLDNCMVCAASRTWIGLLYSWLNRRLGFSKQYLSRAIHATHLA